MFSNHFRVALRSLRRHPGYTFLNVIGLGVGMAVCLLIGLYVHDEMQVDRFHENAERIVHIGVDSPMWGRGTITPFPLARLLANEVPGVERAVRYNQASWRLEREDSDAETQQTTLLTGPDFFDVFTFPAVLGDAAAAVAAPDGLVLTESVARVLFGDADPIGHPVVAAMPFGGSHRLTVRAVIRDVPTGSTMRFGAIAPYLLLPEGQRREDAWNMSMYFTYALLQPGVTPAVLEARLAEALTPHFENEPPAMFAVGLPSLYLSDLHNPAGFRGQTRYLYIFGFAALFVLLIAGINYVNLATAQGMRRAREIGVRKSLGAFRGQLARQFLGESLLLSLFALILAVTLATLALPTFNTLFDKSLTLEGHAGALAALALFGLAIGVLAGGYPALVLSRFHPMRVLRGQGETGSGAGWLRKSLVVVQFAASSALLISTAVIHSQVHYMQTKDPGFDGEQLVSFDLRTTDAWGTAETIRQLAAAHPAVLQAAATSAPPTGFGMRLAFVGENISTAYEGEPDRQITISPARVDAHFVETLGLRLVAGRSFHPDHPQDADRAFVINEATARELGWTPEEAIGKPFRMGFGEVVMGEVIGVVEDFHIGSMRSEIPPVGFQMSASPNWSSSMRILARLSPDDIPGAMRHLEATLKPFARDERVNYAFVDDLFHALYAAEMRLGRIFTAFAGLAILVACMGLFGLAAFAAQARTKEIGIRKVLGASVGGIVGLLSRDFLTLVVVAFVIAAPLAWWGMNRWLEDFAYRIEPGPAVLVGTAAVALAVAFATVAYHGIRAATADPVSALRSE
jgi:putative ABC transport system permease protein